MATRDPGSSAGADPSKSTTGAAAGGASSGSPSSPDGPASSETVAGTQLRDETRRLGEQARERARSFADERKRMAADRVGGVAQALRSAADSLRSHDQGPVADYIGRAAEGLDRVSSALRERDLGVLAKQAQDIARQQPALLIGGAMVAGFLAARFARASGERQDGRRLTEGMSEPGSIGRGGGQSAARPSEGGPH